MILCRNNPHRFNDVFLGGPRFDPDPGFRQFQREICRSVAEYHTTVVYSGNMLGKDFVFARLLLWWLYTRPYSLVIVTAPTQNQIGSICWKEVRRAVRGLRHLPRPRVTNAVQASPQQVIIDDGWQALGFATKSVERASGQHAGELLVLVIEGSGIEPEVWEALDSLGADREAINGNPIRPDGRMVELIHQSSADRRDRVPKSEAVNSIRIASTESPHAHLDKSPMGLADRRWIEMMTRRYGKDSLWVRSHIRAEIPSVSADQLIPLAWLDHAAATPREPETLALTHPAAETRWITADLGEGVGRDSTSIMVTDEYGILECVWGNALDLEAAALALMDLSAKWHVPHHRIAYDRVGIGREMHLHLSRLGITEALGYAGSGKATMAEFTNLRTQAAFGLRAALDPEGAADWRHPYRRRLPFCLMPGDWWPRLRDELSKLTYRLVGTQTALLSKDDHCRILGHSPDLSDSLMMRFGLC